MKPRKSMRSRSPMCTCNPGRRSENCMTDLKPTHACWDLLAQSMVEYRPSFLCGDFNMALFSVVPELRARGFQINLAAWYCWKIDSVGRVQADSCGIFRIGPCQGIRMCFDASVFGIETPKLPSNCSMVMEILRDDTGKESGQRQ